MAKRLWTSPAHAGSVHQLPAAPRVLPQMLTGIYSKGEKGAWKSAQKWSHDAWLDMGVLSMTLFAFVKPNKKLAVDM
jgi:hypothetical protein